MTRFRRMLLNNNTQNDVTMKSDYLVARTSSLGFENIISVHLGLLNRD